MTLVYQAYGLPEVMRQTLFSVTSLLYSVDTEWPAKILIYSDQPSFFRDFFGTEKRVHIEEVSMDQIKKWRGKIDFVHRVKIEILIDAAKKYTGSLFYADGDTYFLKSPKELFSLVNDRVSLMHIAENALASGKDPISKKMNRFVKKNTFKVEGEEIHVGPETVMWNAGVIGISEHNKKTLKKILQLTDEMHSLYPKHVTEQLAVSYCLQTTTEVLPASEVIYHYWNQKPEYQAAIDKYLQSNRTLHEALKNFQNFIFPDPPKPKAKLLRRIWRRLATPVEQRG